MGLIMLHSGHHSKLFRRLMGTSCNDSGQAIVEGAPVSTGLEARETDAGDYRFFAGRRSDPFFFDRRGAVNNLQFSGDDFFADKDLCRIVLEVPNFALGGKTVGLWHRTLLRADGTEGDWIQAERDRLSREWPGSHRRRGRRLPFYSHKWQGDAG
jgi:hypothetical protein